MNRLRRMSQSKVNVLTGSLSAPILSDSRREGDLLGEKMDITDIQTNSGPHVLMKEIEIHFEGDGLLGIEFENRDGKAEVKGAMGGTVASEYIELLGQRSSLIDRISQNVKEFDALIMPTVPQIAPSLSEVSEDEDKYHRTNLAMLRTDSHQFAQWVCVKYSLP